MLIKCPECGKSVSDRAMSCPGCGFPLPEIEPACQVPNVNANPSRKKQIGTVLPSKKYRVQIYMGKDANGKRIYKSFTSETAREAKEMAHRYKASHKVDDVHAESFERAMEHFFSMKTPVLSPSSIRAYRSLQKMLITNREWFCKLRIDSIGKIEVQTLINELCENLSPKSTRDYNGFISSVLALYDIKMPKCNLPQKKQSNFYIPNEVEITKLISVAEGTDMEIPILLAALGPLRRGEIWGLDMGDITGDIIHVNKCLVVDEDMDVVEKDTPKTFSSDRYIEFPHFVIEKILEQGYIVKLSMKKVNARLARLLDKAGLNRFRFHDLRHAFVSIAHAHGIPDAEIQRRGGWATNHVMNTVYRHSMEKSAKETTVKISEIFSELGKNLHQDGGVTS